MTTGLAPREAKKRVTRGVEILTPERLSELAEQLGLDPRGAPARVRRRLLRSGQLGLERLLRFLCLFELQDWCWELGVDPSGRDPDRLRAGIAGREPPSRSHPPSVAPLPLELQDELRSRRRSVGYRRLVELVRRGAICSGWGLAGAALAHFLCGVLVSNDRIQGTFAIGGFIAAAFIRARGLGRFGGMLVYGVSMILATFIAYDAGIFLMKTASHSQLCFVWGTALVAGAVIGVAEELSRGHR